MADVSSRTSRRPIRRRAFRPLAPSLFRENPLAGWKVTISANRRIGIPLLLHAREGVSYLRPSLNSPSVKSDQRSPALASSSSLSFPAGPRKLALFYLPPLPSFFLFSSPHPFPSPHFCSLIFTENPERPPLSLPRRSRARSSKIAFRGSAERKWSLWRARGIKRNFPRYPCS